MKTFSCACVVVAALVAGHVRLAAADALRLKHLLSISLDAGGGGLNLPEGVACGANGQIVVGDTGNDRLLRFDYRDKAVSGGTEIKIAEISAPVRIQLNSKGEIFALDGTRRRIARLGPDGEFKGAIEIAGVPPPTGVLPKGIAIDSADNIYVLDVLGARVLVLNAEARFQKALPLPEDTGFAADVAVDGAGNVLVLDSIGRRVFAAGKDATAFKPLGGNLTEFVPTLPTSITAPRGIIFIAEGPGSSIVGFGSDGSFLSRQLAMGWGDGSLRHPAQMCVNDTGDVVIADRDNSRVQVFQVVR